MKNSIKTLVLVSLISFISFSFIKNLETEIKEIKIDQSTVTWKAYKVTGSHKGIISLKSGSLTFSNNKLVGGEMVIDMTTIKETEMDEEYKKNLEDHLKSDDFFGVTQYPTATLTFKNVQTSGKNSYSVAGDLTIKGKTNPITFKISIYGSKASAYMKIDRSKYDVKYGSASFFDNLKDKVIYDEFDLIADLVF